MYMCKTFYFLGNAEIIISSGDEVTPQGRHRKDCLRLLLNRCNGKGISGSKADKQTENNAGSKE